MIYPTLYKQSNTDKTNQWQIEVKDNCYRTISGYVGMKQTTTEWTCCEGKNIGKSNETTPNEQAIAEAEAIFRKRKEKGYTEDIKKSSTKTFFEPMLAKNWEDEKHKIKYPIHSQPKLDGIRCIAKADGLWSRTGKPIISAPHVYEALQPIFSTYPDLVLDGELYADKFANDFNAICSIVKKTKPTNDDLHISKESIQYHVYDVYMEKAPFTERYKFLGQLPLNQFKEIVRVSTYTLHNENQVQEQFSMYVEQGYEGQILRLNGHYENKRSKSLLKHKEFIDEEYTILDVEEGIGNKAGMVGAFVFKNKDGKTFKASPKFNWDDCKQMWLNKNELIGKPATVKYFNLTPDLIPRFPYVIAIRDYE
jgi:DNA ligase-1